MTNIADAEDSFLAGSVVFEEWMDEFDREYFEPLLNTLMALALDSMDPGQLEMLRTMNPQSFDTVMKKLGR